MIAAITLDSRPVGNPAFARQDDAEGWTALVNLDRPAGVALNATGMMVWDGIDGKRTVAEIITELRDRFADAPPTLSEDVLAILEILREVGLIGYEVEL